MTVLVVVFIAAVFAAGFIVAMRDADEWCRQAELDELWDDGEEVDGGRSAIGFVATTRGSAPAAVDDFGGAA